MKIEIDRSKLTKEENNILDELINKSNKKMWNPSRDEKYFYIEITGQIDYSTFFDSPADKAIYELGNCFETEDDVIFAIDKIKTYVKLRRFAEEYNTEDKEEDVKYYIVYDKRLGLQIENVGSVNRIPLIQEIGNIYFYNDKDAVAAIEKVGEENILKYLFEVGD